MMQHGRMRHIILLALLLLGMHTFADERQMLFNDAWRFHRGDAACAMQTDFSDERWHMVDLPHDWRMIPDSLGTIDTQADTVGWYRKTFTIRPEEAEKEVFLYFERIHGQAEIWVNGCPVYRSSCSYQPVRINVTPYLHAPWENNTVAVRVSSMPWDVGDYRGAGITHDTWLLKKSRIHFDDWNTQIHTKRVYMRRGRWHADMSLSAMVRNAGAATDGNMEVVVTNPDGKEVFNKLYPVHLKDSAVLEANIVVDKVQNWSYDIPAMYKASLRLQTTDNTTDTLEIPFGISTIEYTPYMGLVCNDESSPIQGVMLDYNNRLTGYTAFRRAESLLVEHMQFYGYTSVRCPMGLLSEHFLTACDTLGVMVLIDAFSPIRPDEEWSEQATVDNIRRFRNHPSIVMWCINDSLLEMPVVEAVDKSRPIAVTDMLQDYPWSKERNPVGSRTALGYSLDTKRLAIPITMNVSAPDTTQTDTLVWLPEEQRWAWPGYEGDTMKVTVYSDNEWVHLYLNGRFVGNAKPDKQTHQATYYIPYVPGVIHATTNFNTYRLWQPKKARSKIKFYGRFIYTSRLFTDSEPDHLFLSVDRKKTTAANGELCFVRIEVQGINDNLLPDVEVPLTVHIRGPGLIVAAGNSEGLTPSLQTLRTHQGSAMVVIRPFNAVGTIRLTVFPEGMEGKDITVDVGK